MNLYREIKSSPFFLYNRTSSLLDNLHPCGFSFPFCLVFRKTNKLKEDVVKS